MKLILLHHPQIIKEIVFFSKFISHECCPSFFTTSISRTIFFLDHTLNRDENLGERTVLFYDGAACVADRFDRHHLHQLARDKRRTAQSIAKV